MLALLCGGGRLKRPKSQLILVVQTSVPRPYGLTSSLVLHVCFTAFPTNLISPNNVLWLAFTPRWDKFKQCQNVVNEVVRLLRVCTVTRAKCRKTYFHVYRKWQYRKKVVSFGGCHVRTVSDSFSERHSVHFMTCQTGHTVNPGYICGKSPQGTYCQEVFGAHYSLLLQWLQ